MEHVLRSARTQRAATSVFVPKAFIRSENRMERNVLPRVGILHTNALFLFLKKIDNLLY